MKFVQKKTPAPARMQMLNQTLPLTCEQMNCPVIVLLLTSHQKSKWKPSLLKNSRLALQITVQDTDVDTEVVDKVCADDNSCQQVAVTCEPAATVQNELTGLDNHVSEVPAVPKTKRISLIEIRPYLNCSNAQCTSGRRGRRAEAAAVLTASPYKDKLVEKLSLIHISEPTRPY